MRLICFFSMNIIIFFEIQFAAKRKNTMQSCEDLLFDARKMELHC